MVCSSQFVGCCCCDSHQAKNQNHPPTFQQKRPFIWVLLLITGRGILQHKSPSFSPTSLPSTTKTNTQWVVVSRGDEACAWGMTGPFKDGAQSTGPLNALDIAHTEALITCKAVAVLQAVVGTLAHKVVEEFLETVCLRVVQHLARRKYELGATQRNCFHSNTRTI